MAEYEFNVKDYRIIKEASFSPEGITLIYARNGSGKSSLLKSLVSLLSQRHQEDNFRHGKDSYSISARVGENTLAYTRNGGTSQLQFNGEAPRTKLGQGPMSQVEPRFPLKRVDYIDSSFYPNISFQNSVPVFEDISVESLFSSMFSDMARLSERVTACRNDCVNTSKAKNDSQVSGDMLKAKVSESAKSVDVIKDNFPDLDSQYKSLRALAIKRQEFVKFQAEYGEAASKCIDANKQALVSFYKVAQPLFKDLVLTQKIKGLLDQKEKLSHDLFQVRDELAPLLELFPVGLVDGVAKFLDLDWQYEGVKAQGHSLPEVSPELVSSVSRFSTVSKNLKSIYLELDALPEVSVSLMESVQSISRLEIDLASCLTDLSVANMEDEEAQAEMKKFPCNRLISGLCPYQGQLKI